MHFFLFFFYWSLWTLYVSRRMPAVCRWRPRRKENQKEVVEWKFEAQINTNLLSPCMTLSACSMWHSTCSSTCSAYLSASITEHRLICHVGFIHSSDQIWRHLSAIGRKQVFMSVRYKIRVRGKEKYFTSSGNVQWWPICWEESCILYTEYTRHYV